MRKLFSFVSQATNTASYPINNYNLEVSFDEDTSDPKADKSLYKSHELLLKSITKFVSSV